MSNLLLGKRALPAQAGRRPRPVLAQHAKRPAWRPGAGSTIFVVVVGLMFLRPHFTARLALEALRKWVIYRAEGRAEKPDRLVAQTCICSIKSRRRLSE